jgi:hypothetical protein
MTFISYSAGVFAQENQGINVEDSLSVVADSQLIIVPDSLHTPSDSLLSDGFGEISPDALDARVDYAANDSIRFEIKSQKVFMHNGADISYQDINLKADYVELDFKSNTINANGVEDSTGTEIGTPVFTMGENTFESKVMKYNYETKQGLINKIITQDGEGYLHGTKVKVMPDKVTNISKGSYTTCNLEHPHFEFRFSKAKAIPDKKIVTGPAYFVVEDVPTPIALPFGLFPNKKGQTSGIVVPTFGESASRGFYLENGGYYWAINEYLDFKVVGDLYSLGSWAIKPYLNYRKRYKYNGMFNMNYAINLLGEKGSPDFSRNKDFSIRWIHNQDGKARPNSRFSANVNLVSNKYNKFNPVSTNDYLSNTFQSSVNYSTSFAGKYNLNATLNHSQNTNTHEVDLTLPKITFNVNQFYPLRSKNQVGAKRWTDNVSFKYDLSAENRINTLDSLIFQEDITKKMRNGLKHRISVSSGAIKVLKNLIWSNTFNYNERWYSQSHIKNWSNDTLFDGEEISYGYVKTDTVSGFNAVRDFSFSSSLSTTVYGMFAFKKGPVKAIRHVIKPSISFSYRPDFSTNDWGYYKYYINQNGDKVLYSMYDGFVYSTAPSGKQGSIGFMLKNNLEMKVRSAKDTITGMKKIVLIEDLSLSSSYNLALDSVNLSAINLSGRTRLFKDLTIKFIGRWDPYALNENRQRINKFEWVVNNRLLRPESFRWDVGFNYKLDSEMLQGKPPAPKEKQSDMGTEEELRDVNENIDGYVDWNVPWTLNLSYTFSNTTSYIYNNGYWDYEIDKQNNLIQTLAFNGNISLTPKWKFGFNTNYNIQDGEFSYTSLNIYRDLHCWQMSFNWIPFGFQQSWNFTINIKSSLLQDLKLDKKRDQRDYY